MIKFTQKGDFSKFNKTMERMKEAVKLSNLDRYGKMGVDALSSATPKDTGKTASSWHYKITHNKGNTTISFHNSNIQNGFPIAIMLQYGHGTKNGGFVQGKDYINPSIKPVFEKIADEAWKEVIKA